MCFFKNKAKKGQKIINSKFLEGEMVDFWHKDDVYFGRISEVHLSSENNILYDIDIAGQCPTTFKDIEEEKVIRIHIK